MYVTDPQDINAWRRQAEELVAHGKEADALRVLSDAFQQDAGDRACYRLAAQALRGLGGTHEAHLFEQADARFDDPHPFYELGFRYVEDRHFRLARAFLERADGLAPGEPGILVELAVCYSRLGRFRDAIAKLEQAPDLTDHFWPTYQLCWCHLIEGDLGRAASLLDVLARVAHAPDEHDALPKLDAFLDRLRRYGRPEAATVRSWHFTQYGAVVLNLLGEQHETLHGRYRALWGSYDGMAEDLVRLERLLGALNLRVPRVMYAPTRSAEIIASALGSVWDLPVGRALSGAHAADALVVAATTDELHHLDGLDTVRPGQILFAYHQNWARDGYVNPDVCAVLAEMYECPWGRRLQPGERQIEIGEEDHRPVGRIADQLGAAVGSRRDAVADDEDWLAWAVERREGLIPGRAPRYAHRPRFSTETPLPSRIGR